ncbi:Fumarylacetoacetase N-terminal [Burkholderia sp. GAS332]|nr:Fumarylacetoacetase N-terminal [Burkholderia sp. GAS332]
MRADQRYARRGPLQFRGANQDGVLPIRPMPFSIFSRTGQASRPGSSSAIGSSILDLCDAHARGMPRRDVSTEAFAASSLKLLFVQGPDRLRALRCRGVKLFACSDNGTPVRSEVDVLFPGMDDRAQDRPTTVANYKWVPVADHGHASSVRRGIPAIHRPFGQRPRQRTGGSLTFDACEQPEVELEIRIYVAGRCPWHVHQHPRRGRSDRQAFAAQRLVGIARWRNGNCSRSALPHQELHDLSLALDREIRSADASGLVKSTIVNSFISKQRWQSMMPISSNRLRVRSNRPPLAAWARPVLPRQPGRSRKTLASQCCRTARLAVTRPTVRTDVAGSKCAASSPIHEAAPALRTTRSPPADAAVAPPFPSRSGNAEAA